MSREYSGQIPQWLENNQTFANDVFPTLPAPWSMADRREPAKKSGMITLTLTCLDPRCVPETFFGPDFGAGVVRNAGGRVTDDVIRTFTALRGLVGVKTIAVVHHTDCGVTHLTPKEIVDWVAQEGPEAKAAAESIDYKLFKTEELEDSIKEDVRLLRNAPSLTGVNVYGFKLDTFTGKVEPVEV